MCYGLLYHLEAAAVFELIENIHRLTARLAVIDTHYSLVAAHTEEFRGEAYAGSRFREHAENATTEEKLGRPWSSLHNTSSFWLTRPALFNLLHRVGFSTVYEAQAPLVYDYYDRATDERFKYDDRSTFVAVKSVPARILTSPAVNRMPHRRWPESLGDRLVPSPREFLPPGSRTYSALCCPRGVPASEGLQPPGQAFGICAQVFDAVVEKVTVRKRRAAVGLIRTRQRRRPIRRTLEVGHVELASWPDAAGELAKTVA